MPIVVQQLDRNSGQQSLDQVLEHRSSCWMALLAIPSENITQQQTDGCRACYVGPRIVVNGLVRVDGYFAGFLDANVFRMNGRLNRMFPGVGQCFDETAFGLYDDVFQVCVFVGYDTL